MGIMTLSRVILGCILLSLCSGTLHHVMLRRKAVPVSRVFSQVHRPWARKAVERMPAPLRHIYARRMRAPLRLGGSLNGSLPFEQLLGGITTVGEYYVELYFGGQPVRVQVDTGSSTLAVPLSDCKNCRPGDQRFNLRTAQGTASVISCNSPACMRNSCGIFEGCNICSASTRACCSPDSPRECGFFLMYADNSGARGALVEAEVSLAGFTAPVIFGGILKQVKNFEAPEVDGILGMAYKKLACNPTCVDPLFDTLVETGKVKADVFSLCTGKVGGTMTLGGNNPNQYHGKLQYVPMGKDKEFYDVNIRGMKVGGEYVKLRKFSNGIVDSGTTLLVITTKAYLDLKRYFQRNFCHVPGLCVDRNSRYYRAQKSLNTTVHTVVKQRNPSVKYFDQDDDIIDDQTWFSPAACVNIDPQYVSMLPDLTMELDSGVTLTITPEEYMLKLDAGDWPWNKRVYRCLGIQPLPGMDHLPNNVIIGDTVLQKYYYEIDRANNRVGFAKSRNCVLSADTLAALRSQTPTVQGVEYTGFSWSTVFKVGGSLGVAVILVLACMNINKRPGYTEITSS